VGVDGVREEAAVLPKVVGEGGAHQSSNEESSQF
jgi:hypothetical protein